MKCRSRIIVPDVGRNRVPDYWTTGRQGTLPKLCPCSQDNSCIGCRGIQLSASRVLCVFNCL